MCIHACKCVGLYGCMEDVFKLYHTRQVKMSITSMYRHACKCCGIEDVFQLYHSANMFEKERELFATGEMK